jgi:hypothetical protein
MSQEKKLTTNAGAPVADNQRVMTAGARGPMHATLEGFHMKTRSFYLSAVVAVTVLIAVSQIMSAHAGPGSVSPEDRLSIEQPRYSGQWKGNDLTVEYTYSKDQGHIDLTGNVRFSYSLTMGYKNLRDFRLGAVLLDQNGRVIEEIGLLTNRGSLDPISFSRRIKLPSNAVSMAFSYQGKATDVGRDKTSFWFSPVH